MLINVAHQYGNDGNQSEDSPNIIDSGYNMAAEGQRIRSTFH